MGGTAISGPFGAAGTIGAARSVAGDSAASGISTARCKSGVGAGSAAVDTVAAAFGTVAAGVAIGDAGGSPVDAPASGGVTSGGICGWADETGVIRPGFVVADNNAVGGPVVGGGVLADSVLVACGSAGIAVDAIKTARADGVAAIGGTDGTATFDAGSAGGAITIDVGCTSAGCVIAGSPAVLIGMAVTGCRIDGAGLAAASAGFGAAAAATVTEGLARAGEITAGALGAGTCNEPGGPATGVGVAGPVINKARKPAKAGGVTVAGPVTPGGGLG